VAQTDYGANLEEADFGCFLGKGKWSGAISMKILRKYQEDAVSRTRAALREGHRRVVIVQPTGSGKSLVYAEIMRLSLARGGRCLFVVHRRGLVAQMIETLREHGITDVGIIMAGHESNTDAMVQVATIQTLSRRLCLEEMEYNRFFVAADVVLVDECHCAVSKRYQDVLSLYKDKIIIGCTATPMRSDGRGLGEIFDAIVDVIGVGELTDAGFLARARYFVPAQPDLANIKISRGDYEIGELGNRMNQPKLIGDIVDNWLRIAPDRKTIVFCVNVKHAISVAEAFRRAGVSAIHLSAKSPDDEREQAFRDMDNGNLQVLCNVALYVEGMDCPDISCVVMARPTKSLGLYRQACGRGLRPNGDTCTIIDHGGVVEEHGALDDEIEWSLDGTKKAWTKKKKKEKEKKVVKCSFCALIFEGARMCPDCGSPVVSFGKPITTVDADLVAVGPKKRDTMAEKIRFYGMLEAYRKSKGYSSGWTANQYRSRFGVWPKGIYPGDIEPDTVFLRWIKHKQIQFAKSKLVRS
jgi:superfamily II DNA or RNA helicase